MTPQLYSLKSSLSNFLMRHHPVIFIATVLILLSVAVYMLYEVLTLSNVDASTVNGTSANFDKATANRIKDLQVSGDKPDNLTFPAARQNPFVEKK